MRFRAFAGILSLNVNSLHSNMNLSRYLFYLKSASFYADYIMVKIIPGRRKSISIIKHNDTECTMFVCCDRKILQYRKKFYLLLAPRFPFLHKPNNCKTSLFSIYWVNSFRNIDLTWKNELFICKNLNWAVVLFFFNKILSKFLNSLVFQDLGK